MLTSYTTHSCTSKQNFYNNKKLNKVKFYFYHQLCKLTFNPGCREHVKVGISPMFLSRSVILWSRSKLLPRLINLSWSIFLPRSVSLYHGQNFYQGQWVYQAQNYQGQLFYQGRLAVKANISSKVSESTKVKICTKINYSVNGQNFCQGWHFYTGQNFYQVKYFCQGQWIKYSQYFCLGQCCKTSTKT